MARGRAADDRADGHDQLGHGGSGPHDRGAGCRGGWRGEGIRSLEHWVQWKAGVSERRAQDLVKIARRIEDLPRCWALFAAGRISEDTMARLARRLPAGRDAELARLVPELMVSQLNRILRTCPSSPTAARSAAAAGAGAVRGFLHRS